MKQYKTIFLGRINEAARDLGKARPNAPGSYPSRLTPLDLARWFVHSKALNVAPATFRMYRASIAWGIKEFLSTSESSEEALQLLASAKATNMSEITEVHGRRTSAKKSKGLTKRRLELLKTIAMDRKHLSMAPISLHLLQATMVTGLRPAEWISSAKAPLQSDENQKFSFGVKAMTIKQGSGDTKSISSRLPYRTIPVPLFSDLTDSEIQSVEACLSYVSKIRLKVTNLNLNDDEKYDELITLVWAEKVRKIGRTVRMLSDACNLDYCKKNEREHTTLYSARHQFKTDAEVLLKKHNRPPDDVEYLLSALMGHNNPSTQKGYGDSSKANYDQGQNQVIYLSSDLTKSSKYLANIIHNT